MSKQRTVKLVTAVDVKNYAESNSDFSFEMAALRLLNSLHFSCEHGGTYRDPATGKAREFDIRAISYQGSNYSFFPVECKNVSEGSPVVIHTVPRPSEDAFHQTLISKRMRVDSRFPVISSGQSTGHQWRVIEVTGDRARYKSNAPVGKHLDQIANYGDDGVGSIQKRDGGIFDKFSQALSSSVDLVVKAVASIQGGACLSAAIVPVVVVPDGRLWEIPYSDSGKLLGTPKQLSRVSLLVRHTVKISTPYGAVEYTISHAEIVTLTGLGENIPLIRDSDYF
jgi:hypothetical protein